VGAPGAGHGFLSPPEQAAAVRRDAALPRFR
jgi:hypothetical protein